MPKFKIVLDRAEYLTATMEIEAESFDQAVDMALTDCWNDNVDWECYDSDGPEYDPQASREIK